VQYVTFLMGGNKVCTSEVTTMTTPFVYETQFRNAMNILTSGPDQREGLRGLDPGRLLALGAVP